MLGITITRSTNVFREIKCIARENVEDFEDIDEFIQKIKNECVEFRRKKRGNKLLVVGYDKEGKEIYTEEIKRKFAFRIKI